MKPVSGAMHGAAARTASAHPAPTEESTKGGGAAGPAASQDAAVADVARGAAVTGGGPARRGFRIPPGLAGRAIDDLPPGIRRKLGAGGAQGGGAPAQVAGGGAPSTTGGGKATSEVGGRMSGTMPTGDSLRGDVGYDPAREEEYERYLQEHVGRGTGVPKPEGFDAWARAQLAMEISAPA